MKFVHIADMHFDSPFVRLSDKNILGDLRRLEQRKIFKKIIDYIKGNNIEYFFISGDLYEHEYIKQSTIQYINNLFKEIPETKVFISPGNHDPYLKNSYYNKFEWSKNVKIFGSKIERIETEEADIYGFGFDDFYCYNSKIEELEIINKEKTNILIVHANLDASKEEEKNYNNISSKKLKEKGFDYIALGHIHNTTNLNNNIENKKIVYPGSTIALGFDEPGDHGMMVGKLEKDVLKLEFIPLDQEAFVKKEMDITEIFSKEDLIEKINNMEIKQNQYIEIILNGNRNFEINKYDLLKYIQNERIIKIKDQTKIAYDLEKMANDATLKGLFIKEMLEQLKKEEYKNTDNEEIENERQEKLDIILKSIEIGLDALE